MVKHLVNISAYPFDLDRYGGREGLSAMLDLNGLDGLEMLTGHFPSPGGLRDMVGGIHLPYAVDWYSVWCGSAPSSVDVPDDDVLFLSYGRDRQGIVSRVRDAIDGASCLEPAYGVFHGGAPELDRIFSQSSSRTDKDVISALCDMLNEVVSPFPGGEPPFPLMLENLWWPGLRLMDPDEVRLLEQGLEFDDWGLCLDVGHLMNALRCCRHEEDAVSATIAHLERIPADILDRINVVHLHLSLSSQYQEESIAKGETDDYLSSNIQIKLQEAFHHFSAIDWHAPFRDPRCSEIVDMISPEFITHEFICPHVQDLNHKLQTQLAHFRSMPRTEAVGSDTEAQGQSR